MELKKYLKENKQSILNLGCGKTKPEGHWGIDITDAVGVDLVADLNKGIPVPDNTFDTVLAVDFLEHIKMENNIKIMEEIYRVVKPGGSFQAIVPSTDGVNTGAFQDPTHFSFWPKNKFMYFLDDAYGQNFRSLYNIKSYFKPEVLETFWNEWNICYVRVVLKKAKD